jgi:hypothetical protein
MTWTTLMALLALATSLYSSSSSSYKREKELKPYSFEEDDVEKGGSASKGELPVLYCYDK